VFGDLLRNIEARFPWLSTWLGGRLEVELPAFLVSVTMHGLLLVSLAFAGYRVNQESTREFQSGVVDNLVPMDSTYQDLDQTANPPAPIAAAGSFAPTLAPTITSAPSSAGVVPTSAAREAPGGGIAPELIKLDVRRATELIVPTATLLGQTVSIRGNGAELVGGVEGAVDRIAVEILRHLERGRTLVVWAFDASGSLLAERQRLSKHIETVYTHINQLDESHLSADSGLLTMVYSFGQDRRALLPKPTADRSEIIEAIQNVGQDTTGVETTFTTVGEIVNRFGRFKDAHHQPYHTMIIIVTDEVGDDQLRLEDAISMAQHAKVQVYVLGSQAVFGRDKGYVDYVDPKTKHVFHGVPVDQGPESLMIEQIRLPFWYGGLQYDIVEAGFGPYALSRLASATGGIYFVTRFDSRRMGFDPARMREYKPDWDRRADYEKKVADSPLRRAVLTAAQITQQKLPAMPTVFFPPADAPEFKEVMAVNQGIAERTAYTVDEALVSINSVVKLRDREISRRWQAHYDLIRGRLLAMKVRCYEYNWACARMKKDPPKFSSPKFNAWRLVPDQNIQYSEKAAVAAREAQTLLRRVIEDHPTTPWALLAERELKDPLGFKWVENFVQPRPRGNDNAAAQRKNKPASMAKPPEMPKL
jgi:von Willebrand factor type A domain-containing protein